MFRFFRKIRFNLLREGKLGKYITYASGEILLVMIGILLALQVNTWQKKNELRDKEIQVLDLMIRDLNADLSIMARYRSSLESQEKSTIALLKAINEQNNQSILEASSGALNLYNYRPHFPTFEGLKQSGSLDLISDSKVRNDILGYHEIVISYLDDLRESHKKDVSKTKEEFLPYLGYEYRSESWEKTFISDIQQFTEDREAINALGILGKSKASFIKTIDRHFKPRNEQLSQALQTYMNSLKEQ